MFLLHPKIAQLVNARAVYTPFVSDGLNGSVGTVLYAQQANRLLAMGQQCLASTGGTASLCGGASGPGGGPAGAGGASLSGASHVAAGGSNGACGGVPVGGQESGRSYHEGSTANGSPYYIDDLEEIEPLPAPGFGGGSMMSRSEDAGGKGLVGGVTSNHGVGTNDMLRLAMYLGAPVPPPTGGPTCLNNKNNQR